MLSPVRGSPLRGISGTTWPGRRSPSSLSRPSVDRVRLSSSSTLRKSSLTAIGASEVVSTPPPMPRVDLTERDPVRHGDHGRQAGAARLLQVRGRGLGAQRGAEHALAGEVEVAAVLEHGTGDDGAEPLALQAEAADQPVEGGGEHVLVGRRGVVGARPGERDAVAAEDGDGARGDRGGGHGLRGGHDQLRSGGVDGLVTHQYSYP